jgi:hypothetical protein
VFSVHTCGRNLNCSKNLALFDSLMMHMPRTRYFIEEEDDVLERSDKDAPVTLDEESDSDSSENIVDDNE